MTLRAEHRRVRLGRNDGEVHGVLGLRAMASLASDAGMFARSLLPGDIDVAGFAGLVPGMDDRQRRNLRNRIAAVMPIFAKAVRDEVGSQAKERQHARSKQSCDAQEVSSVLHECFESNFRPRTTFVMRPCLFNRLISRPRRIQGVLVERFCVKSPTLQNGRNV